MNKALQNFKNYLHRPAFIVTALLLATVTLAPLVLGGTSSAAQLTNRSLTISSGIPGATGVTYTYGLKVLTATQPVQGVEFQACTAALGTCTAPTGLSFSSATLSGQTGWDAGAAFTLDGTGANNCIPSASELCIKRTDATNETATAKTVVFSTNTNPTGAPVTFFVRITTYNVNTYTTGGIVDTGTTAAATTQTLTVNAAVQEVLSFCVGNTSVNDGTTVVSGTGCAGISGTSLNLGTLQNSQTNVSPVPVINGGDNNNGVAMLQTNASNGASVVYQAIQQSGGTQHQGSLKVSGASCTNDGVVPSTSTVDQCINSAGASRVTLTAGTEMFGMTIAAVNCNGLTAYTCTYAGGTYHLTRATNYNATAANTYTTDSGLVSGTTNASYAWDESGSAVQVASSSTVVANEALILKFAATPNITTPTGAYTAQANFVATPTY